MKAVSAWLWKKPEGAQQSDDAHKAFLIQCLRLVGTFQLLLFGASATLPTVVKQRFAQKPPLLSLGQTDNLGHDA